MVVAWPMPVYRQPFWLETFVYDFVQQVQSVFQQVIGSNEKLAYWLNLPFRGFITTFTLTIGVSMLWMFLSFFSSWKTKRNAAVWEAMPQTPKSTAAINADGEDIAVASTPPHHRPPPHRKTTDIPSLTSDRHVPFGIGKTGDGRAGRVSIPGYQTPFVSSSGQKNFLHLKQSAPVTYATLRQDGLLEEDGTPTKKGRAYTKTEEIEAAHDSPPRSQANKERSLPTMTVAGDPESEDEEGEDQPIQDSRAAKGKAKAVSDFETT